MTEPLSSVALQAVLDLLAPRDCPREESHVEGVLGRGAGPPGGLPGPGPLFAAAAPEDEKLAVTHGRIAAKVGDCTAWIEVLLFEAEDLEVTARLARFERLIAEMGRDRKLALMARLEKMLGGDGREA